MKRMKWIAMAGLCLGCACKLGCTPEIAGGAALSALVQAAVDWLLTIGGVA